MATPVICSEERTNFFRVCRVVLDHIPEVLRAIFKDRVQRRHKHTWDDTSDSGTKWLYVKYPRVFPPSLEPDQERLLKGGQTKEWDPTLLFRVLMSPALCLLLDEIPGATVSVQNNVAVVSVPSGSQVPASASAGRRIRIDNGKKCVYGEVASVSPGQIVLTQTVTIKPSGAKVHVYTPEFEAVGRLRKIRNVRFAHRPSATTPTVDLDDVFENVKQAYIELGCSGAEIESLVAIKTEAILDEDTRAYYQRRFDEQSKDYERMKKHVESNTQAIEDGREERQALREEVNTLKQQVQDISVAPSNMDSQPTPTDQPLIPMLDTGEDVPGAVSPGKIPVHQTIPNALAKKRPTSKELSLLRWKDGKETRIMREVGIRWWDLGCALGFKVYELETIEANSLKVVSKCNFEMFGAWARKGDYTWGALIRALEDAELEQLAKDVTAALNYLYPQ